MAVKRVAPGVVGPANLTELDPHRPPGAPRSREPKSQKVQVTGELRHGFRKDRKIGMTAKTRVFD
ncbi:MAG: hypothetical protein AB1331_10070 [Bacillota bacterium]